MIHAFALEPELVATWGRLEEFRYFHDKFGLGTPRVLLELPAFHKWKRKVFAAAQALGLTQKEMKRLEEVFQRFGEHKHRRADAVYDGVITWLENAEREHGRRPFKGILARQNPRRHPAVLNADQVGSGDTCWTCESGTTPARTPEALASALAGMLLNCRQLHLVDPHFGPENRRHRRVLEAFMGVLAKNGIVLERICIHCSDKAQLSFFEDAAASTMATRLPNGAAVEFVRWRQKRGGERLHNRYVLTDIGGVALGGGLDEGDTGQTDDLLLLPREVYILRWKQYVDEDGAFECVDRPATVTGSSPAISPRRRGG